MDPHNNKLQFEHMTKPENSEITQLLAQSFQSKMTKIVVTLLISVLFPLLEAVLINYYTGGADQLQIPLLAIAGFHLIVTAVFVYVESIGPSALPVEALANRQELSSLRSELQRRSETYRLIRKSFDLLNKTTCDLALTPNIEDEIRCKLDFQNQIARVLSPLIESTDLTVGVSSNRISVFVCFVGGFLEIDSYRSGRLHVDYVYGRRCGIPDKVDSNSVSEVVNWSYNASAPGVATAAEAPHMRCETSNEDAVTEFAWAPIFRPCTTEKRGVIVLASRDSSHRMSSDILDTLQFIASIVASHTLEYSECVRSNTSHHRYGYVSAVPADTGKPILLQRSTDPRNWKGSDVGDLAATLTFGTGKWTFTVIRDGITQVFTRSDPEMLGRYETTDGVVATID